MAAGSRRHNRQDSAQSLRDELVVLSVQSLQCDLLYILHDLLGCLAISGLLIIRDIDVWIGI